MPIHARPFHARPTAGSRRSARLAAAAAVLVVGLVLAGCSPTNGRRTTRPTGNASHGTSAPATPVPTELARFYSQTVTWKTCSDVAAPSGEKAECGTVTVPLDWAAPTGQTIELSVARLRSTGSDPVGSILVNPGGPGASAVDFLETAGTVVSAEVRDEYDLVAFDPRGVQRSAPVHCYDGPAMDKLVSADFDLSTDAGVQAQEKAWTDFGAACAQNTGAVLGHVDTISTAKDMDVVRAAVGDVTLDYLGYSYGTKLGATYAALFPTTVGRMVLDSALDPTLDADAVSAGQAAGFESALRAYVADCLGGKGCPLTGDVDTAMKEISGLLTHSHTTPLPTGTSRRLTAPLAFTGIAYPLYSQKAWPMLTQALTAAVKGDGSGLLQLADAYYDRDSSGRYTTNTTEAFTAIGCLDSRGSSDLATMRSDAAAIMKAAPTVGQFFAYTGTTCAGWPVPQVTDLTDYSAKGAPPIVVIGTTNDPATPYVWAQKMASTLSSGVLLTHVGEGHGAYGLSNDCVKNAVDDYFLDGTAPKAGARC